MTISPGNIHYHEIVGLRALIGECADNTLSGFSGKIVSESRNMIAIAGDGGKTIQIAKNVARRIELETPSGVCFISGSSLIGRPEDRLARLR